MKLNLNVGKSMTYKTISSFGRSMTYELYSCDGIGMSKKLFHQTELAGLK